MLIRFGGGAAGIKEYLEEGKKQGRELSRDELDRRIVLEGDLDICDRILQSRDTDGERYDHVTMSFKEDDISEDTLRAIAADFKAFALSAYGENEMYFYAEAHMPRTATEEKWNAATKQWETVKRHPHIHVVIPKTNLVTGERASAFELLTAKYGTKHATMEILDAFQEHINDKYQLASPKANRRTDFIGRADILSRIKADNFMGRNREHLATIRNAMLEQRIESPEAFRAMLEQMGVVAMGHGKDGDYLKIRLPGNTQYVRLKDYQFSDEFVSLPMAEKMAFYEKRAAAASLTTQAERITTRADLLATWQDRAREIKYLSPSSKFFKEYYAKAQTIEEKRFVLDRLEAEHYQRLREEFDYVDQSTGRQVEGRDTAAMAHDAGRGKDALGTPAIIARNLRESAHNFAALAAHPGLAPDALGEHARRVAAAAFAAEYPRRLRGRASGRGGDGIKRTQGGGLDHDGRDTARTIRANLRAADADHRAIGGLGREFWEAALANRAGLECAATARRIEAYANGKLNSLYLRTIEELQEAHAAGERIIAAPDSVIEALTWNESLFGEAKLEHYLLKNTADQEQFDEALEAVLSHPILVVHQDEQRGLLFTSSNIVAIESKLIESAKRMVDVRLRDGIRQSLNYGIPNLAKFNQGQREAYELLCSDSQLAVVNGAAGTGKSYVLAAMREAYERDGFRVLGAILQGKTAEDLERDSGINSRTIARLLLDIENGNVQLDRKTVLVVDEAGMVGSRHLQKLVAHAEASGARLRLIGDAKQIAAVEYGNAFVEISKLAQVASLTQIMRQKEDWMWQASEKFAGHDITGLHDYNQRGFVRFADTATDAQIAIAGQWMQHFEASPDKTRIVLAHTNKARSALNTLIRTELQERGYLEKEIAVQTVFGPRMMATGDQLMFTRADKALGVKNGTTGVITEIGDDGKVAVALSNGKTSHFFADGRGTENGNEVDYGYAVTIHKAQGMTVDKAFVLAENSMAPSLLYVAMTRHREGVEMFASSEEFQTFESLARCLARPENKEFSIAQDREWQDARRPSDSVIGQMLADIGAEKVIKEAAQKAPYREIVANLDAQRIIDHVSKSHGIDPKEHSAIIDEQGRQRIQTGEIRRDVAHFLTAVMHLDYKTQAAPILKQCYGEQLANVYSASRYDAGSTIDQAIRAEFVEYRQQHTQDYRKQKERLDAEKRSEKSRLARSGITVDDYKIAYADLTKRIREEKKALQKRFDVKEPDLYKAFLAERAVASEKHLNELWRVAVTPEDKATLAAIEETRAAARARAVARAESVIAATERQAETLADEQAAIKPDTAKQKEHQAERSPENAPVPDASKETNQGIDQTHHETPPTDHDHER